MPRIPLPLHPGYSCRRTLLLYAQLQQRKTEHTASCALVAWGERARTPTPDSSGCAALIANLRLAVTAVIRRREHPRGDVAIAGDCFVVKTPRNDLDDGRHYERSMRLPRHACLAMTPFPIIAVSF